MGKVESSEVVSKVTVAVKLAAMMTKCFLRGVFRNIKMVSFFLKFHWTSFHPFQCLVSQTDVHLQ